MTTTATEFTTPHAEELPEGALQDVIGGRNVRPKGYIGETENNLRNQQDRDANSLMEEEGIYR